MKTMLTFLFVGLLTSISLAGNMKDLLIAHEESITEHLFDLGFELKGISNSRFIQADPGYDVAIISEVEVYSPKLRDFDMKICTSQFVGDSQSGFQLATLDCQ